VTWVRLDDNFHWHPKVAPLSDAAYRLYVGALCYSNRYELGGRVTIGHVGVLVGTGRRAQRLIDELVVADLWTPEGVDWLIHDYLLYQPDPTKQAAGRMGGRASAQARAVAPAQADPKHAAVAPLKQVLNPRPVPVPLGSLEPRLGDNATSVGTGVKPLRRLEIPRQGYRGGAMTSLSESLPKVAS
jgi:hypothetical protein